MKIAPNQVVFLSYELSIRQGDEEWDFVETAPAEDPMAFIYGMSGLPESFEANLLGLEAGSKFDFMLEPEEGYGELDPDAIVDLPKAMFQEQGAPEDLLKVGNMIPMTNEEGHQLTGHLIEVHDDFVVLDFNHPLAGRSMHFKGTIEKVRPATPEELDHGHVHGDGGVHH